MNRRLWLGLKAASRQRAARAGDRDKARQPLTEAVSMYREIGMPKHMEMAEAMLGEV
jgi:hypothetical protein